jgi:predicted RND superfamily exporter protein
MVSAAGYPAPAPNFVRGRGLLVQLDRLADNQVEHQQTYLWVLGLADKLFSFRWLAILATIAFVAAAGYGIRYLQVDPDTRLFFSDTSPERQALEKMEKTFGKYTDVFIVIAPDEGSVFTEDALRVVSEVTDKAWEVPLASRVDSLTNYKFLRVEDDEFIVEDLVPEGPVLDEAALARIRERALKEPALVDQIVASDAEVTGVSVTIVRPLNQRESIPEIAAYAEQLVAELRAQHPGFKFYLTGGAMADWAFAQATYRDMARLMPLMAILVVACLWIGLRSIYSVIAALSVVIMSMIVAMGAAGWMQMTLNSITVGAPVMSMTLAIADCMHLLSGTAQLRRKGLEYRQALAESLRLNWSPILLTSVTTTISFLALNFADSPPLRDVGNIVAIGVASAWLMSVTSLPAFLAVLPAPKRMTALSDPRLLSNAASLLLKHRAPCLFGSLLLVAILALGIGRMRFDDDFIKYFSPDFAFRHDTEFLQNNLTGFHTLQYLVPSGRENGVTQPQYLRKLDEFAAWFREQEHVTYVSAITDTLKRVNQVMHGDDPAFYRTPDESNMAAQYLLLYEMSLPEGFDINNQVDIGKSTSRVSVQLANVTSEQIKAIGLRGEEWLADHGLAAPTTGISIMYAYLSENNIRTMIAGTFVELVCISLLMIFIVRSVKLGLLSLIPNLSPAILAFGLWGWLGSEVNLAVSVVAAMTFGIIVDDTIHTLVKYNRARRDLGMDVENAVRHTYVTVGEPMLLTGVTLVLGFGVLAFSGFAVTHQLGLISAMIIALAIFTDLLMLPPLLIYFDRTRADKPTAAQSQAEGGAND